MPLPTSRAREFWTRWKILHIRQLAETGHATNELWLPEAERTGRALDQLYLKHATAPRRHVVVDTSIRFAAGSPLRLSSPMYLGDMSFGALSGVPNAAIAKAADLTGIMAGTGEGGPSQGGRRVQPDHGPVGIRQVRGRHQFSFKGPGRGHQDRPGREAWDRRPPARSEGHNSDLGDEANPRGHGRDLARPPPRHLLDRGPGPAHPRPQGGDEEARLREGRSHELHPLHRLRGGEDGRGRHNHRRSQEPGPGQPHRS